MASTAIHRTQRWMLIRSLTGSDGVSRLAAHGLLGPAAKWRPLIVPNSAAIEAAPESENVSASNPVSTGTDLSDRSEGPDASPGAQRHPRNYAWSELMNETRFHRRRVGLRSVRRKAPHPRNDPPAGNDTQDSGPPRTPIAPAAAGAGRLPETSFRLRISVSPLGTEDSCVHPPASRLYAALISFACLERTSRPAEKVSVTRTLAERNRFYTTFQEPEHPATAACT